TTPGHYRVLLFVVTSRPLSQDDTPLSHQELKDWLHERMLTLPTNVGNRKWSPEHRCTVLVYELERSQPWKEATLVRSRVPAREQLERTNLLPILEE
ncbi:unnamed protein product, partial [marine sediment metagenome]